MHDQVAAGNAVGDDGSSHCLLCANGKQKNRWVFLPKL